MTHVVRAPQKARRVALAGLVGLVIIATALAGCTGGPGADDARIDFDGIGHGTQRDVAVCDQDAHLTITAGLSAGLVVFRVTDGADTEIFMRTINAGLELEDEPIHGAEGSWAVEATRSSSFDGFYAVSLDCAADLTDDGTGNGNGTGNDNDNSTADDHPG